MKPFGIEVYENWASIASLFTLIEYNQVGGVVQIGLKEGGLSQLFIFRSLFTDFQYLGLDSSGEQLNEKLKLYDNFYFGDVFTVEAIQRTTMFVLSERRILIYCDGEDKEKKVKFYWPLLKPNDLLMVVLGNENYDWLADNLVQSELQLNFNRLLFRK